MNIKSFILVIKNIFQGWFNLLLDKISDIKYKSYFDERMNICRSCQDNKDGICGICHCVLKAKTKSEDSACPLKKWDTIENTLKKEL